MRKLLWTALVATVSAACASAAVRALEWAWRRATKRPPPDIPGWAHFLVGKPLRKQIAIRIRPPA
jgi:hypothetical protein